ncbi:MAG: hypothetical protein IPM39_13010 [Chloroflexi bacterium]|nr:hypothetical protein [Chloroflexota bacterium]
MPLVGWLVGWGAVFCFVFPLNAAQTAVPPILANSATVNYPNDVRFSLQLPPDTAVTQATLRYDVPITSCLEAAAQVAVPLTPTANGPTADWTWVMSRSGNPPPGAVLWWEWLLTDADGRQTTTPRQSLTFTDDRFNWQTVSDGRITLHWYRGDIGPLLLEAATDGLARLETDMGIQLQDDVQFYIYGSAADMRAAVLYVQDWAGGLAFSDYNTILIGVPPASAADWGRSTVRHELAHLVTGQFAQSCVGGQRPTWLEEGLAVYAEGAPSSDMQSALAQAQANNSFEPLRSLAGSFPAHSQQAGSAYAQSYSVVDFMLAAYGRDKLQELLLALAAGQGSDAALEQVYGVNVDGLEAAWRAARGLPERPYPPTPTPISAAAVATIVPMGRPASLPTPPAAAAPPPAAPTPSTTVCGPGAIPLAWIGLMMVYGRRKMVRLD